MKKILLTKIGIPFKKGHTPWNKGIPMKEETKEKLRIKRRKQFPHRLGVTLSREIREKISASKKGIKQSKEHKQEISKALREWYKNNPHRQTMLGKKQSTYFKELMSKLHKGKVLTEETKQKIREARAKQILPVKDTLIELKIQKLLSLLHIEFYTHKYISEITHGYQCDILIPVQNLIIQKIIIECDGCFFHACELCNKKEYSWTNERKEIDKIRTKELIDKGFKVIRLWEHEIKVMELNDLKQKIW